MIGNNLMASLIEELVIVAECFGIYCAVMRQKLLFYIVTSVEIAMARDFLVSSTKSFWKCGNSLSKY